MVQNRKKVRIVVSGAAGQMGTRILSLADKDRRFQIIGGVESPRNPLVGRIMEPGQAPVVANIAELLPKADVVIDFSVREAVLRNAPLAAREKRALVIGTTGFSPADLKKLKALSGRIPIVLSPNMSKGVNVLFKLVERAARALADYDIEIVEAHHSRKKDSPSGTALRLAEIAARASGRSPRDFVFGRKGASGPRSKREIGILAIRAGDIVGDHTVFFGAGGERLELTHRAQSRDALASGALEAAAWVQGRKPGFYSMADVLKI